MYTELQALEAQRKAAEKLMEKRDAALRLENNSDFKLLIMEGFLKEEVIRNTAMSADPAYDPAMRADSLAMAQAGGHLSRYIRAQIQMANTAQANLEELDEAIVEARTDEGQ